MKALRGIRVLEVGGIGPGPFATMMLSDMGAEVVRVDRASTVGKPQHPMDSLLSRGRRSIGVDLKSASGIEVILRLVESSDVLIEGFRPGVMEGLGIGPDVCLERNPRLVFARMTGYGQDGPLAKDPGHDINYISVAGALGAIGRAGDAPTVPLNLVGDFAGGSMMLIYGITCALLERVKSDQGQVVDAAMVDGVGMLMSGTYELRSRGFWSGERGKNLLDSGAPFFEAYETRDGKYLSVGCAEPQFYARLLEGLGLDANTLPKQRDESHWPSMKERFQEIFRTKTRDEWCDLFAGSEACVTPVLTLDEAPDHPHNQHRRSFVDMNGELVPAPAPRLSRTPPEIGARLRSRASTPSKSSRSSVYPKTKSDHCARVEESPEVGRLNAPGQSSPRRSREEAEPIMLSPYRVLDLTQGRALMCGQMLADLGADVIQIEPPGGSPTRRLGPFAADRPDVEQSLFWWAYARNKRSMMIDLDSAAGQDELRRLVQTADFLIESDAPGEMARRGLGYPDLETINPRLVYVSITPYGQDGPKSGWAATDLTVVAASGVLGLTGDADRPPVRVSVPQAFLHAATDAALGALLAHFERARSGHGQLVDISAQQSLSSTAQGQILAPAVGDRGTTRSPGAFLSGGIKLRMTYPASDGHVSITHVFGSAFGPATRRLMEYVHDNGFCDAQMRDKDWVAYGELIRTGAEPIEEFERAKESIAACTGSKTKAELLQAALDHKLLMAPMTTLRDVLESEQLDARGYFQTLDQADGRRVRYPGPFAKFGASPIRYDRRPPRIDEHGAEVRREAAENRGDAPAQVPLSAGDEALPLAGVKVLDFMWALAGPGATRILADFGATVVRVESSTRLDPCRTLMPFLNGQPGAETSAIFHTNNANKRMITLDLNTPEGREVALDLVRWADVVAESFSPGTMQSFGLDYQSLKKVKPDLIMLSTCLMGQTGPLKRFAGYGNLAAALFGFYEITGWPDRDPAGPFGGYTDYMAPRYNATSILAALEHRRRTGEGQYIDVSQAEAALHFLTPAVLDFTVNGRVQAREGNRDREMAPHGVYPCAGDDRWVAIAVRHERDWRALCEELGQPELSEDPRFADAAARRERCDELDAIVSAYTEKLQATEVEARLQERGVPASNVQTPIECARDPQLVHRKTHVEISHATEGRSVVEGTRIRLSRTPARIQGPAPTMGLDNEYVLQTLLGYDSDRMAKVVISGALG